MALELAIDEARRENDTTCRQKRDEHYDGTLLCIYKYEMKLAINDKGSRHLLVNLSLMRTIMR